MDIRDNSIRDEGLGVWKIQTYQPENGSSMLGPFYGHLLVDSKLYTIKANYAPMDGTLGTTVLAVPSQNVAYVINVDPALTLS